MTEQTKVKNKNNETLKAGCVLINEKGEVLLVSYLGEKWTIPKGHAENGENLEQVALRETKEETGYDVEITKRLSDATYSHSETGELIRVAMFRAKPIGAPGKAERETKSEWFPIETARKIIYPNLAFILDEIE